MLRFLHLVIETALFGNELLSILQKFFEAILAK